jgi:hypothetical protein
VVIIPLLPDIPNADIDLWMLSSKSRSGEQENGAVYSRERAAEHERRQPPQRPRTL